MNLLKKRNKDCMLNKNPSAEILFILLEKSLRISVKAAFSITALYFCLCKQSVIVTPHMTLCKH